MGEGIKPGCAPGEFGDGCWPRTVEMSQDINLYSSADLASWTFEGVLLNQACPARVNKPYSNLKKDINLYSSADLASWTFEGALVNQAHPARANTPYYNPNQDIDLYSSPDLASCTF